MRRLHLAHTTQNVAVSAYVGRDSPLWGRMGEIGLLQYFVAQEIAMDFSKERDALFISIEGLANRLGEDTTRGRIRRDTPGAASWIRRFDGGAAKIRSRCRRRRRRDFRPFNVVPRTSSAPFYNTSLPGSSSSTLLTLPRKISALFSSPFCTFKLNTLTELESPAGGLALKLDKEDPVFLDRISMMSRFRPDSLGAFGANEGRAVICGKKLPRTLCGLETLSRPRT
jgi:hypothetical protein